MVRVTFAPQARRDLIEITDYLSAIAGPHTARKYETRMKRLIDNLRDVPSSGSPRREFGPNVRILIVRPYLIFYEDQSDRGDVLILRILHGSRNITDELVRAG